MDCRGSLRNLAMTEDDAKPAVIASRKAKQSSAVPCRRMDCRGSLRNLAMTEDDAKPAVIAIRKAKQSSAVLCQRMECRGSLRNLAMTGEASQKKRTPSGNPLSKLSEIHRRELTSPSS